MMSGGQIAEHSASKYMRLAGKATKTWRTITAD